MAGNKVLLDTCHNQYAYIDIRYIDNILYNYIFYYYYKDTLSLQHPFFPLSFILDLDLLDLDLLDQDLLDRNSWHGGGGGEAIFGALLAYLFLPQEVD